jgi:hypothetical protein
MPDTRLDLDRILAARRVIDPVFLDYAVRRRCGAEPPVQPAGYGLVQPSGRRNVQPGRQWNGRSTSSCSGSPCSRCCSAQRWRSGR